MIYKDHELYMHHKIEAHPDQKQFFLHTHMQNEVFCLIQGTGYYTVEGNDYPLSPGCIMIMREGEPHTPHISAEGPYERIALHFTTGFIAPAQRPFLLAPFMDRPLGQRNYLAPSPHLEKIQHMMLHMTEEQMSNEERSLRIRLYIPTLLYEIASAVQNGGGYSAPVTEGKHLVSRIIDYINEAPQNIENMDMLAEHFKYSYSYINQTFRQSMGISIWDYVILKRLTMARDAIRSGVPAVTAAQEAGFTDYSSFYRQFKKRFGTTPANEKKTSST